MFFRANKKDIEREKLKAEVDRKVELLKMQKEKKAIEQRDQFSKLNDVVREHGIDGVWFLVLGGKEKEDRL